MSAPLLYLPDTNSVSRPKCLPFSLQSRGLWKVSSPHPGLRARHLSVLVHFLEDGAMATPTWPSGCRRSSGRAQEGSGPQEGPGAEWFCRLARAHTCAHTQIRARPADGPLTLPLTCCHEQDPRAQDDVPLGLVDPGGCHAHAPEQQQDGAEDGEDAGGPDHPCQGEGGRSGGTPAPGAAARPLSPLSSPVQVSLSACALAISFSLYNSSISRSDLFALFFSVLFCLLRSIFLSPGIFFPFYFSQSLLFSELLCLCAPRPFSFFSARSSSARSFPFSRSLSIKSLSVVLPGLISRGFSPSFGPARFLFLLWASFLFLSFLPLSFCHSLSAVLSTHPPSPRQTDFAISEQRPWPIIIEDLPRSRGSYQSPHRLPRRALASGQSAPQIASQLWERWPIPAQKSTTSHSAVLPRVLRQQGGQLVPGIPPRPAPR